MQVHHTHTHTPTHTDTYTNTHLHTYTKTHIHTQTHTNIHTYKRTHTHTHTHIQTHTHARARGIWPLLDFLTNVMHWYYKSSCIKPSIHHSSLAFSHFLRMDQSVFCTFILILLQKRISLPRDRTVIVSETDAPSVDVLYWSKDSSFLAHRLTNQKKLVQAEWRQKPSSSCGSTSGQCIMAKRRVTHLALDFGRSATWKYRLVT
jgi:hypothetical protein